jgi:uncharacterized protein with HEPN domain
MSKRDVKIILKEILNEINKIDKFTKDIDYETFVSNEMRLYAVIRCLEVIGEGVRQLPEDFKKSHSSLEWRKIVDLRNILIHQYFGIELKIIWDVVKNKIPVLKHYIEEILKEKQCNA